MPLVPLSSATGQRLAGGASTRLEIRATGLAARCCPWACVEEEEGRRTTRSFLRTDVHFARVASQPARQAAAGAGRSVARGDARQQVLPPLPPPRLVFFHLQSLILPSEVGARYH